MVEGRALVRVLSVAQRPDALEGQDQVLRKRLSPPRGLRERPRDRGVVGGRAGESAHGQTRARRRSRAARRTDLGEEILVVLGLDGNGHAGVVLRGRADQRGPPDIDHLDRLGGTRSAGDRLLERIEVHDDEIEGFDRGLRQVARVVIPRVVREYTAEDLGMKRLDAASQDLRKAGRLLDRFDLHPFLLQVQGGSARRDDSNAARRELPGELRHTGLVVDGDEGPADRGDRGWERDRLGHGAAI